MADFPKMPLFTDAFLADTTHLSAEEVGVYILLLIAAWRRTPCALPDDDKYLAGVARCSARKWTAMRRVMMQFFTRDESGEFPCLVQKKLLTVRTAVDEFSKSQTAKADRRWNKPKDLADAGASPRHMPETNSAHAPRCLPVASSQYKKDSSSNGDGEESQRQVLGNFDFLSDDGTVLITAEEFEQLQAECPSITNVRSVTRHACRTWLTGVEPERRKPRLIAWLHAKNTEMAGRKERRAATKPPSATDEDRLTERQRRFAADKEREEASARAIEFRRKQDEQRRQRQEASHDT